MKRAIFLFGLCALAALQIAAAVMPQKISYQGVLRGSNGSPVNNGDYQATFRLYNTSTGGTAIWTETDTVTTKRGTFSTILGDNTAFNLAFDQTYWLGITVGSGSEMTPRNEFTASPYALRAAIADSLAGGGSGADADWVIVGNDMYSGVSGNVGIGAALPTAKLEVEGDNAAVRASSPSMDTRWIQMLYHASIGPLLQGGPGYSRLTIDACGDDAGKIVLGRTGDRVGVGIMDPTTELDVVGTVKTTGFELPTGASSGRVLTCNASGVGTWQDPPGSGIGGSGASNYIPRFTGSTTIGNSVIYQGTSNRIGIGTTSPSYALDVVGDIRASGSLLGTVSNADKVDNYHAGNASGQVAVSNGTKCTNLNADAVDGYSAGNASGQVALSNGTTCTNLNADKLDGYNAGNASGDVPVSNGTKNANLNAEMVDNNHVISRSIYTASSNDYIVDTSWAKVYAYGTSSTIKIENPSGSGNSIRYVYSLDYGAPTSASLSSGQSVTVSFSGYDTLDIRVSRFSTTSDAYHITFQGINMYNGHIRGHVIYDQ